MLSRWRPLSAASILTMAAAVEVGTRIYSQIVAIVSPGVTTSVAGQLGWAAIELALLWGVWKRSSLARYMLIAITALPAILVLFTLIDAAWFPLSLVALSAIEVALLVTPQVRAHTRPVKIKAA